MRQPAAFLSLHPGSLGVARTVLLACCVAALILSPASAQTATPHGSLPEAVEEQLASARAGVVGEYLSEELEARVASSFPRPERAAALARVALELANVGPDLSERARPMVYREAAQLARLSLRQGGRKPGAAALASIGVLADDPTYTRQGVAALLRLAPQSDELAYFQTMLALQEEDWDGANAALERAHQLGMGDAEYARLQAQIEDATPLTALYWRSGLVGLGGWLAGFVVLFVVGALLSHLTLMTATRLAGQRDGAARGVGWFLRAAYRALLLVTSVYFYASLPLVAIGVAALAAVVIYACFALGRVPLYFVVAVFVGAFVTVWAVLSAFWAMVAPRRESDPGPQLDLGANPRLSALLEEAAQVIGTRKVDAVYLTVGTEFAVFERGGFWARLRDTTQRCLIVGVGGLAGLNRLEMRSILAHEYGHYRNEDTAGGSFALAVRHSFGTLVRALAEGGADDWRNPAWWFVHWFERLFLRVSQGASRLQEILADRWAIFAYGSDAFVRSTETIVASEVRFGDHLARTVAETFEVNKPQANLYRFQPSVVISDKQVQLIASESLAREPLPFDSHPSHQQRIAWAQAIGAPGAPHPDDEESAWSLFSDRIAIEELLTEQVRRDIRRRRAMADALENTE